MSGTFPSTPIPSSINFISTAPTLYSVSQSGRRNVRQLGAQRWSFKCSFSQMNRQQMMPVMAFMAKQQGRFGTFLFTPENLKDPQGDISGSTPVVSGSSQVGSSVNTQGWKISTIVLKAGDIIKFVGHTKVYMITDDVTSDGSGLATINIQPALYESIATLESITVSNVQFSVQQDVDDSSYTVSKLYDFSLNLLEVI